MTFVIAQKEKHICLFVCVCVAALCSDRVSLCIYWTACLQTVRLDGCQHRHSLPRIDPPTALLLSALLCCIDVFSKCIYCIHTQTLTKRTLNIQNSIQKSLPENLILSLTLLLHSSSPLLGGITLPRSNESAQTDIQL